jgi:alkanesulfonate monooxygenase SsuD/methylene tetrahydromethanopterin reductase-like flavin-dependent oxidoreductase (luciferase family)
MQTRGTGHSDGCGRDLGRDTGGGGAEAERRTDLWPIEVATHNLGGSNGGLQSSGRAATIASFAKANNLTLRQTAERCSVGLGHRPLVGTTQSIADDLQAWLEAEATDGFAFIQPLVIDGLRDFSEHIIPELVRRALFRSEYEGKTPRDNLGLARLENYYRLLRNGTA